jgi:ABC-type glycerol-3-phosphate transport system substrate-binding protein
MKKAIAVVVGTILIGLMLAGCATTQSGQPAVTFNTLDRGKIRSAIINDFKKLEFKVVSETNDGLILEGRRLGYTGRDTMHAILRMVTTDGSTTVAAQAYLKSEGSFGRDQYTDEITYSLTGTELLKILQRVKAQVESE